MQAISNLVQHVTRLNPAIRWSISPFPVGCDAYAVFGNNATLAKALESINIQCYSVGKELNACLQAAKKLSTSRSCGENAASKIVFGILMQDGAPQCTLDDYSGCYDYYCDNHDY